MASLDLGYWLPILATVALAVGTLIFAYWQVRQNQRLHSTTTLLDLRDRFYGHRMCQSRRTLSAWLLSNDRGEEPDNWEVALFFEFLGSLTRSHDLDYRLVRKAFGTWVTGYYTRIVQPVNIIERWRKQANDPLIFADFEWLAKRIIESERRAAPAPDFDKSVEEEALYVLDGETRLEIGG
jgi:hypothetical protein